MVVSRILTVGESGLVGNELAADAHIFSILLSCICLLLHFDLELVLRIVYGNATQPDFEGDYLHCHVYRFQSFPPD